MTKKNRCSRDKVLILWDLTKQVAVRTVPTYECVEAVVGLPLATTMPRLNVTDVGHAHVLTAGDRGLLRVWNMATASQVYTQTESLVSRPDLDGAPSVTQIESDASNGLIYVVTFDHNILVHRTDDLSLVKQVK